MYTLHTSNPAWFKRVPSTEPVNRRRTEAKGLQTRKSPSLQTALQGRSRQAVLRILDCQAILVSEDYGYITLYTAGSLDSMETRLKEAAAWI
jgi:hypothetical protein